MWGGVLLAIFLVAVLLTKNNETNIFTYRLFFRGQNVYGDLSVKWIFMKVLYYIGVVIISFCVLSLVPVSENKFLNNIGQKTMQIFFWHIPLRNILFTTDLRSHLCTDFKGWLLWIVISVSATWLLSLKPFGFPVNQISMGVRNTVHNES